MAGLISAYWPYLLGVLFLVGPAALTLICWGIGWAVTRRKFAGRVSAAVSAGAAFILFLAGLLIFFFWPTTPTSDPHGPAMPGGEVLFRLFDGFALMAGGALALLATLLLWGVFELVKHSRSRPAPS